MDGLCGSNNLVIADGFLSQCFVEAVLFPACVALAALAVLLAVWQGRWCRRKRVSGGRAPGLGAALALLGVQALLPLLEVGVLWAVRGLDAGSVLVRAASAAVAPVLLALACVLHRAAIPALAAAVAQFGATALLVQMRVWSGAWLHMGLLAAQLAVLFAAVCALWYALEAATDTAEPTGEDTRLLSVQEGRPQPPQLPVMVGSPEEEAWAPSRLVFWWTGGLMSLGSRWGSRLTLQMEHIWPLACSDRAVSVVARLEQCEVGQPRLFWLLVRMCGPDFAVAGLLKLINDTCVFAGPLFLNLLLFYLETPEWPLWLGCLLALGMFLGAALQTLAINAYFFRLYRVGIQSRTALGHLLLAKLFRVQRSAAAHSLGSLTTLLSVDAGRPLAAMPYLHVMWSAPLQIGVALYLLFGQLGVASFAGLGAIALLLPVNFVLAKGMNAVQERLMKCKDGRMAKTVEVFQGIRVLKYYVWEDLFEGLVRGLREAELRQLRTFNVLNALSGFAWMFAPVLVALVTFSVFTALGHDLTPSVAFSSVALFNVLRFPLNALPVVVSTIVELRVSLTRMQAFLDTPERAPYLTPPQQPGACIEMAGATFVWPEVAEPTLVNVSFALGRGQIAAVVGRVGSGKSALLAALLGDMQLRSGRVALEGSVAYVAQTPWIQNCSLRDNILFGLPFDAQRYAEAVDACQLRPDIDLLSRGDRTEIGEKGINLSGGQKQRVALARAVYSDKEVLPITHTSLNIVLTSQKGLSTGRCAVGRGRACGPRHFRPRAARRAAAQDGACGDTSVAVSSRR